MKNTQALQKELAHLDLLISSKYLGDNSPIPQKDMDIAYLWLEEDVSAALTHAEDMQEALKEIANILDGSTMRSDVYDCINLDNLMRGVSIRRDFATALRSVKCGRELSAPLRWGFSPDDLNKLAKLHKANKFRKKIEDLLTDCNFHTECEAMASGNYLFFFK